MTTLHNFLILLAAGSITYTLYRLTRIVNSAIRTIATALRTGERAQRPATGSAHSPVDPVAPFFMDSIQFDWKGFPR